MQLPMPSLHLFKELLYILLCLLLDRSDVGLQRRYGALRLLSVDTAAAVLAVFIFLLRLILGYRSQV